MQDIVGPDRAIGIVGLGTVGEALLSMVAATGCPVVGVDHDPDVITRVEQRLKRKDIDETGESASCTLTTEITALAHVGLVVEAVAEDLAAKRYVLRQLRQVCPPDTAIVTTASSLPLFPLAAASGCPDRIAGLRLLCPPAIGRRAEVVRTSLTSDEAVDVAERLATAIGLECVVLGQRASDFAARLVYPYLNRAAAMVAEGFASPRDVDTAMRLGCGLPSGPLELIDELGVDEVHSYLESHWNRTGEEAFRPVPLLTSMLRRGTLGRKTAQGFHGYGDQGSPGEKTPVERGRMDFPSTGWPIRHVGVFGSGTMARGVAQVCATSGLRVTLVARSTDKARSAATAIEASLVKAVRRGRITPTRKEEASAALATVDDASALSGCDLVIEAVAENLQIKRGVFAQLGTVCRPGAILATTTSSLSVAACTAPADRPGETLGLHFFNPAPVMKLVELVRTSDTAEHVMDVGREFCADLGKVSVGCPDRAGFIVNRLLFPYLTDAVRLLDDVALNVAALDTAVERGFGYPMGPFALLDAIGLDVSLAILERLHAEFPEAGCEPPTVLRELVGEGYLGRKAGQGLRRA
ncbi:3-hydroxybutyryl-CoA dehydrogenase [Streptomyces sp. 2333.5]|uniref:3-hydroxyacyl-CoA dehydrogenase family protein n=1 Tax=unclassified Streptomyces TaxID=2593676 RepID=UPI00089BB7DD|nr:MULTISPECIES: 3-hydroxyacyl-CoA dehydrogenase family protein [unclassified Streptomyces]PJJ05002.1 3-hydroxybutyryl-CoA dehydrogenase [Streptomyces sp. 2333.5]SEE65546.1 3-hydroxybutyryl-CoA dehydrogenase [Streptomyces sp. 2314.4]SEE92224.1 3-hydroxybutyryl-CoA dehydrogenase [Streptomyces sp. 2112.2]